MHHPRPRIQVLVGLTIAIALLAIGATAPVGAQSDADSDSAEPTSLTVGLGFIPSVQFAQFYLAAEAGYYEAAGLDVTFQNKIDPQLITLLGQGAIDVGMADGTSLVPAVSQGIPVSYGMTVYAAFPSVVFTLAESGIDGVADLAGKRIGVPGPFGSSWIMLQALLASADLTVDDVEVEWYPEFGQAQGLAQGQVDAATGFVNNEPVQLRRDGFEVNVFGIDDVAPLPGPGLVVGASTLEDKPDAVRAFAEVTRRAMQEISEDPRLGLDATFARVPELAQDPETQLAILEATIDAWRGGTTTADDLGGLDRDVWRSALDIMSTLPDFVVADDLTVEHLVTDALQPLDS
jgi:NitT/TauT family transport system substrate-binding protein